MMTCNDLNSKPSFSPHFSGAWGRRYVCRQTHFFASYGLRSMATFSNLYGSLSGRLESPSVQMRRVFSRHGLRSTDLPRKLARHHLMPRCDAAKTLSHGHSVECFSKQFIQRQQCSQLANLRRLRTNSHSSCEKSLHQSTTRHRSRRDSLCTGFDHHRFMFNTFSLGNIPHHQVGGEGSYAHEPSGEHTRVYSYFHGKNARCSYFRSSRISTWCVLRHGSSVPRLRASLHHPPSSVVLRHASQKEHAIHSTLFQSSRQKLVDTVRSNWHTEKLLFLKVVSGSASSHPFLRRRERPAFGFSNEQHAVVCRDDCRALQVALADRIVFQMDQAAPADQNVFRYKCERGEVTNLDRDQCLLARGDHEKGTWPRSLTLRNPTSFKSNPIRENPYKTSVNKTKLQNHNTPKS